MVAHVTQPHAHVHAIPLKPKLDTLCILGAYTNNQPPITPALAHTIQIIELTYCCVIDSHLKPEGTKKDKQNPLINTLWNLGWDVNPSPL